MVPCHPVHIGNIPNLIYQTFIKEHVGTQIWAGFITIGCDLGGSKCESPHLSARFPAIPGTGYIPNLLFENLIYQETWWHSNSISVGWI